MKNISILTLTAAIIAASGCNTVSDNKTSFYSIKDGSVCVQNEVKPVYESDRKTLSLSSKIVECSDVDSDFETLDSSEVIVAGNALYTQHIESCTLGDEQSPGLSFVKTGEHTTYNTETGVCVSIQSSLIKIRVINVGESCSIEAVDTQNEALTVPCVLVFSES
jgi:hypothetical protein